MTTEHGTAHVFALLPFGGECIGYLYVRACVRVRLNKYINTVKVPNNARPK